MSRKSWYTVVEVAKLTGYGRQQIGYFIRPPFRIAEGNFRKKGNKFYIRMPEGAFDIMDNTSVLNTKTSKPKPELTEYLKCFSGHTRVVVPHAPAAITIKEPKQSRLAQPVGPDGIVIKGMLPLAGAQALKENHLAELKGIEVEKARGELLVRVDVEKDAFNIARLIRDAVLNIPDRISAELASITDVRLISEKLTQELTAALEDLSA